MLRLEEIGRRQKRAGLAAGQRAGSGGRARKARGERGDAHRRPALSGERKGLPLMLYLLTRA